MLPLFVRSKIIDLNYLYQRYSVSLHMAHNAACSCSRMAHRELAEGYAAKIADAKLHGTPARPCDS